MSNKSRSIVVRDASSRNAAVAAYSALSKEDQKFCDKLVELLSTKAKKDLYWYWEFGEILANYYKEIVNKTDGDDRQAIEKLSQLAKAIGGTDRRIEKLMATCLRLVERWETRERFEYFINLVGPRGNTLSFSHICELSTLSDDKVAKEQAKIAVEECLTDKMLKLRLKQIYPSAKPRRAAGGGRPVGVPSNVAGCVRHMLQQLLPLVNLFDKAWCGEKFNLIDELKNIDVKNIDKEVSENLSLLEETLYQLEEQLRPTLNAVGRVVTKLANENIINNANAEENNDDDEEIDEEYEDYSDEDDAVDFDEDDDDDGSARTKQKAKKQHKAKNKNKTVS